MSWKRGFCVAIAAETARKVYGMDYVLGNRAVKVGYINEVLARMKQPSISEAERDWSEQVLIRMGRGALSDKPDAA